MTPTFDPVSDAAIKVGRIPERGQDKPAQVRQKDRDARWSIKYTNSTVKEGADLNAFKTVDLAILMLGYKNTSASTALMALSEPGTPALQAPTTAQGCRF